MNSLSQDLLTIRDFLRYATTRFSGAGIFFGHGTDNPWDEAVHLVMRSLGLPLENNTVFLDARLTSDEKTLLLERLNRRVDERVPVPYLVQEGWFMGLPFYVDERVLIPRSPIGELLQNELQPWLGDREPERILDLCTGSGCIGIGAATVFEDAQVDLSDLSDEALAVASINIERFELQDRVRAIRADVFDGLDGSYDVILTNPPYVDAVDMGSMPEEYRREPALALAAGDDGLSIAHRILSRARSMLNPGGLLICEVGNSWPALVEAYPQLPFIWLEFEHGGEGIFLLHAEDLPE